ncbi:MAG: T9SS type A sorting domain-containing protein [Ignavibacteria bacterium]
MKTQILYLVMVLISLNFSSFGQGKNIKILNDKSSQISWIGSNTGNPNDYNSIVKQPGTSDRVKQLLAEQRQAKLSGNGERCEQIQKLISRETPDMGSTIKPAPYPFGSKYIGKELSGPNSITSSAIFNNHYSMQSAAVYTEQIGQNAGRVWVFAQSGADVGLGPDTIRVFYTDNNGATWVYHSIYWLSGTDKISPDGMDVEIIESASGDKYIWLTFAEYTYNNGWEEYVGVLVIREPGVYQAGMFTLTWPGVIHSNTLCRNRYPRITSDNATYQNGASYLYIASSADSSTNTGDYQYQKVAFCTNPYTVTPSITYRAPKIYWYNKNNNGIVHTDIQYFSKGSGLFGADSLIVIMSNVSNVAGYVYTSKFDEHPDVDNPIAGPNLDMGFPNTIKDWAKIAGNGGMDLMVVARNNYNNSGDYDIVSTRSSDDWLTWNNSYIDGRSNNVNVPHQPEIFGKKNRNNPGIFKVAYYVGSGQATGSYDSIYTSYYPIPIYGNYWSQFAAVNSTNAKFYGSMAKPSFMNNPNDSCFVVWLASSGGIYGSLGCEGHISGMGPLHVNNTTASLSPDKYELGQNYPNPFNPTTEIKFAIPKDGYLTVKVYDVLGKLVQTLVEGKLSAGEHEVRFDGTNLSSGIYFYKIETDNFTDIKKMVLLK